MIVSLKMTHVRTIVTIPKRIVDAHWMVTRKITWLSEDSTSNKQPRGFGTKLFADAFQILTIAVSILEIELHKTIVEGNIYLRLVVEFDPFDFRR